MLKLVATEVINAGAVSQYPTRLIRKEMRKQRIDLLNVMQAEFGVDEPFPFALTDAVNANDPTDKYDEVEILVHGRFTQNGHVWVTGSGIAISVTSILTLVEDVLKGLPPEDFQ